MKNLQALDTHELLQLLSRYNEDYALLMLQGTKDEFEQCKTDIFTIQEELNKRKLGEEN